MGNCLSGSKQPEPTIEQKRASPRVSLSRFDSTYKGRTQKGTSKILEKDENSSAVENGDMKKDCD